MTGIGWRHWAVALPLALAGHAALLFPFGAVSPSDDARSAGEFSLSIGGPVDAVGESGGSDVLEVAATEIIEAQATVEEVAPATAAEAEPVEASPAPQERGDVQEVIAAPAGAEPVAVAATEPSEPAIEAAEPFEIAQEEEASPEPPAAPPPPRKPRQLVEKPAPAVAKPRSASSSRASQQTAEKAPQRPNAGRGGRDASAAGEADKAEFAGLVRRKVQRSLRYPSSARRRSVTGNATVRFAIDDAGNLTGISLVKSSGHSLLDEEAMAAVRRAAPFRAKGRPPLQSFVIPLSFALN